MMKPIKDPAHLVNYWLREKKAVAIIVISGLLYNIGLLIGPVWQGKLIDAIADKEALKGVISLAVLFVLIIAGVQIARYFKRFYVRRFANRTNAVMRFMIYNNIIHKNERELQSENLGSLMTKSISDVDACVEGMRKFTTEIFDTGVALAGYLVTLFYYDVKITILAGIFTPVAMLIAEKLKKLIYRYTSSYRKAASELSGVTYDRIENAMLYRINGREEANTQAYRRQLKNYEKKAVTANVWENAMQPIYNVIAMTGVLIVICLGSSNITDGKWTIGMFSSYITLFAAMALKASKTAKLFNSVQKAAVSWARIKPYFQEYQTIADNTQSVDTKVKLKISGLEFGYPDSRTIFTNLDLEAGSGDIIGVTGPVACGKSTFGKLFLGEYPDYGGQIQINGKDLKDMGMSERSDLIAYQGHSAQLMSDTIYNNITIGDEGNVDQVIRMVCFEEDLRSMPEGLSTIVGNGGIRLSGGQQARIALARTLYHRRKIMVLDDPMAAVDPATEKKIMQNLKEYYKDSIMILISHRLAVFPQMDQILLMTQQGKCLCGSHEELSAGSALYRELYTLQDVTDRTVRQREKDKRMEVNQDEQ